MDTLTKWIGNARHGPCPMIILRHTYNNGVFILRLFFCEAIIVKQTIFMILCMIAGL